MRVKQYALAAAIFMGASGLTLVPGHAQTNDHATTAGAVETHHHSGGGWGWIGLLGLIGLYPLLSGAKRTSTVAAPTTTAVDPAASTIIPPKN